MNCITLERRRRFLKFTVSVAASLLLQHSLPFLRNTRALSLKERHTSQPIKEVTPNNEFFVQSYSHIPSVNIQDWHLEIDGLVERPLRLDYTGLLALPSVSEHITLECIGNEVGGRLIGNALWMGVPLKVLLEKVGVRSGVKDLVLHGADGYTDSIPLVRAMRDEVIVAYRMNRVELPREHGYPLRLLVPGIYGMKNVKWLERIELVDKDYKGFWQRRGWSDEAVVDIMSRIDSPRNAEELSRRPYTIHGIAFAGTHGIGGVEISTDGGKNWLVAELRPPLSPFAWTLWQYRWNPTTKGRYSIMVRALDKDGRPQTSRKARAFPEGARGLHRIEVVVR